MESPAIATYFLRSSHIDIKLTVRFLFTFQIFLARSPNKNQKKNRVQEQKKGILTAHSFDCSFPFPNMDLAERRSSRMTEKK
jgi:hypothetical protein